jgi:lipid-A-disaccharide synthase-like uncharacterized protein
VAGHGCKHVFLDLPSDSFQWMLSLTADHLVVMRHLIGVLYLHQTAPSCLPVVFVVFSASSCPIRSSVIMASL